jgi:cation diffusion facilitator family transporter
MLAIIAYEFLKNAIMQLNNKESIVFGKIAIVVTIISIITKEALAQYAFYIARRTENVSIKADAWHHRTDALSSLVILIGIFVARHFWWIDSILGMIVSLMLFYATYEIAKEAITKLLGEKPNPGLINKIKSLVETVYDGDLQPHHFHIHNYVAHQELIFHIKIDNDISIYKGHEIATKIENKIFDVLAVSFPVKWRVQR